MYVCDCIRVHLLRGVEQKQDAKGQAYLSFIRAAHKIALQLEFDDMHELYKVPKMSQQLL